MFTIYDDAKHDIHHVLFVATNKTCLMRLTLYFYIELQRVIIIGNFSIVSLVAKTSYFQCVDLGFTNYNPSLITMVENTICFTFEVSTPLVDPIFYHKAACKLWHLTTICLKVAYAVTIVSHYIQIPQQSHLNVATTIFQYFKGTLNYVVCYQKGKISYLLDSLL